MRDPRIDPRPRDALATAAADSATITFGAWFDYRVDYDKGAVRLVTSVSDHSVRFLAYSDGKETSCACSPERWRQLTANDRVLHAASDG